MKELSSSEVELKKGVADMRKPASTISATEPFVRRCSSKWVLLKILQYLQENTFVGLTACIKKTPTQVFPCEYCQILKNSFFTEHL